VAPNISAMDPPEWMDDSKDGKGASKDGKGAAKAKSEADGSHRGGVSSSPRPVECTRRWCVQF
jgi:hypothetical protein